MNIHGTIIGPPRSGHRGGSFVMLCEFTPADFYIKMISGYVWYACFKKTKSRKKKNSECLHMIPFNGIYNLRLIVNSLVSVKR